MPHENAPSRSFDRPALQLGRVTATGSYVAGKPAQIELFETSDSLPEIEQTASFHLFFDRFLRPQNANRQAICLTSGTQSVASLADCAAPSQGFTEPQYNPVRRELVYHPEQPLAAGEQYRLTVFRAESPDDSGLFAFDEAPLARSYTFDFKVKAAAPNPTDAKSEEPPSAAKYCEAQKLAQACAAAQKSCKSACQPSCANEVDPRGCETMCKDACTATATTCKSAAGCLDGATCEGDGDLVRNQGPAIFRSCAFAPCHSESADDPDPKNWMFPPMGLDLSYKSLIEATAIDVTAHQSHTGEAASVAVVGGNRFGRAMAIIKRSDPGNSFLLYKLLINAQNFDAAELSGALGDEITRLRAGAIAGIPMPAAIAADAAPLSQTELQLISDWIAHGAVTSCEP